MAKLHAHSNSKKSKESRNSASKQVNASWLDSFRLAKKLVCNFPGVTLETKYDGSPVLKKNGAFMAGIATHRSAEPNTLVLRVELEERIGLIEDAPETYYTTEYYARFPVVLVRQSTVSLEILRELLALAWRTTARKTGRRGPNLN
jgi:hypothetical protein